ncbi:nucleotidyltransferase domain-containing protein [Deinococcus cellulosilyticus]|nr:nucleotidyltransferase family protein [Deinococcus cellulosilyticus]
MFQPEEWTLLEQFQRQNLKHWLIGGHGIELVVGHSYRAHEDLDFMVDAHDGPRMLRVLEDLGFSHLQGSLEEGDVFYRREHLIVDVVPIDSRACPPRTFGELAPIQWPEVFLETHVVQVQGMALPTLTAEMHLAMKILIADFYQIPMREKDLVDCEQLRSCREAFQQAPAQ